MNKVTVVVAALALSLAAFPAAAKKPPARVAATSAASPAMAQVPGARAAVDEAAAASPQAASAETFANTSASLHAEDECRIADLSVNRSKPNVGPITTFLNYQVRNVCDASGSGFGSLEIPDTAFTGDPRSANTVKLTIDLAALANQVEGLPLTADITFIKTPTFITRFNNRFVTDAREPDGTRRILTFNNVGVSTTARVIGTANILPINADATANIFWDDTRNITEITP